MKNDVHLVKGFPQFPHKTRKSFKLRIIVYYVKVESIAFKWLCAKFGYL